ncbi:putative casein kinase substrate phosphoprotein PP28 [Lyophyllum shimeji]|uniref:Casein kinase substrate phosphoprotein PP28 n=1 Tax=Lyophyllum shimeji TaxID=47721 RepID=A0A9P3PZ78_LYOSH|nr:putative casein kinase substrate phosphoprotein PP28 [Lyophyllum shimeji]
MVRGTGKFKQKRGGGRNFSKEMTLDADGTAVGRGTIYNRRGPRNNNEDDDDSEEVEEEEEEEEESEEEESGEEEATPAGKGPAQELTRAERRELKKKQAAQKQKAAQEDEEDEDEDLINPNHVQKKLNISDLGAPRELSRREREAKEKADAKERYWKLHLEGKTQEAKADLSRLAKIRAEREAAQAKRKAEAEAKAAEVEAKRKAQLNKRG